MLGVYLILYNWGKLIVIANHDPPLEAIATRDVGILQKEGNERFNLEDLSSLLHDDGVVGEA